MAANIRHLSNAPITEAVIDIQVSLPPEVDFARLEQIVPQAFNYGVEAPLVEGMFEFSVNPQADPMAASGSKSRKFGLRLRSADERYVAMVRLQGFSLSRLPPYEDWGTLKAEAQRLWGAYVQQFAPVKVTRVATRYINNLRLPMQPGEEFDVYINDFAKVPAALPQMVGGIAQRFLLQDPDARVAANVALVWRGAFDEERRVPFILDIDAFATRELSPDSPQIWELLDELHDLKNRCFFGSLTEKTLEMYQ